MRRLLLLLAPLLTLALVAGCASQPSSGSSGGAAKPRSLSEVKVSGQPGTKPTLKFPTPFAVAKTSVRVLNAGTGASLADGQKVSVDYLGVDGQSGKELDTTYGKSPVSFLVGPKAQLIPGFATALKNAKIGSRLLVGIAPKDGFGPQGGVPSAGIGKDDTLLYVIEVKAAHNVLAKAQGEPVTPPAGLPTVADDASGKPTITIPAGVPAPGNLVVQPLIKGAGAPVASGQTITVQYTGVIWDGGKQFDSSWDRGAPADFTIGVGKVIKGWDTGLVGQPVGSRVLLVVPPNDGYGAAGQSSAGIKGTDTLVFVVDILDAS